MAKALGVGGVFFKSPDPARLRAWYGQWLGIPADDLDGALAQVREGGAQVVGAESYDYGRFGWFVDPDGNKVELWQPPVKVPVK
jgi:predicted enzyme related to lactoylglutathione lyase